MCYMQFDGKQELAISRQTNVKRFGRVGLITTGRKNEGCEEDTGLKQVTCCLVLNV